MRPGGPSGGKPHDRRTPAGSGSVVTAGLPPPTVRDVLVWVGDALTGRDPGAPAQGLDVGHLPTAERAALAEALGEGEVVVNDTAIGVIRESRLPGVWCRLGGDAGHISRLEVGERPTLSGNETRPPGPELRFTNPPEDLMNGPAVLAEIEQHQAAFRPTGEPHTVNLSRLPLTPGDHAFLGDRLGEGDVTIRVRGYGETRIIAARIPNVWRVRHYNASDQLLLDTVEVNDFPTIARATPEDLADSAARLSDLLASG